MQHKYHIAAKRQTLPEGRITLTGAITWLAYGKPRSRLSIDRIERRYEFNRKNAYISNNERLEKFFKRNSIETVNNKFDKIRSHLSKAFSELLPKLASGKIQAFGVYVDKYHWEKIPKIFNASPSKIDALWFSELTAFRYGADAIDWISGQEGDREQDRLWARGTAESYSGFIAIEVNAAELEREFAVSLPEPNEATPLDNTVAEIERVSARRVLPVSEDENLTAFLKTWANNENQASRSFSADRAQPAAETHFGASISRDRLRELAANAGLRGARGRPRNSANNSAKK